MLVAGRLVASIAFAIEPGIAIRPVHLQDWLQLSAAAIDAAFDEWHRDPFSANALSGLKGMDRLDISGSTTAPEWSPAWDYAYGTARSGSVCPSRRFWGEPVCRSWR